MSTVNELIFTNKKTGEMIVAYQCHFITSYNEDFKDETGPMFIFYFNKTKSKLKRMRLKEYDKWEFICYV